MSTPSTSSAAGRVHHATRLAWWLAGLAVVAGLVYLMASAKTGPVDPTEVSQAQSRGTVVFNSAIIVFREGLEAVLIFAAVTASFLGANKRRRRPVVAGAACAFAPAGVPLVAGPAPPSRGSPPGPRLGAGTRVLARARP